MSLNHFNINVDLDNKKIVVICNTYWSCRCDGNILLSKYSGEGNGEIDIITVDELYWHDGNIYFTYGDERCDYPHTHIYFKNPCVTLNTYPKWILCNDNSTKALYFKYKHDTDTFKFYVDAPNNEWEIKDDGGHTYFHNDHEVLLVANNDEDFIIGMKGCDDTTKHIHIKLTELS